MPEPVRVDILPVDPHHMELFVAGSAAEDAEIRGTLTVRDKFDNMVDYDGSAAFRALKGAEPLRVTAQSPVDLELPATESNPAGAPRDGFNLFFGDMHTHDFNSTAEGYPADCYSWGRDQKRLDFQALAVQVHRWIDNEKWFLMKHMSEYFLEEGRYVTFLSFEWQHSECGDKIVHFLGNDMPYLPTDLEEYDSPAKLYAAVKKTDAFIISHHPGYELGRHVPGARWEVMDTEVDRLVEIWSMHGSSEGADPSDRPLIPPRREAGVMEGLRRELRVGLVAGSDTHVARPGGSVDDVRPYYGGLCAIWARELTRRGLFEAFVDRRTYALTGARISLYFTVNGAAMGSEIPVSDHVDIQIDAMGTDVIRTVEIMKDGEVHRAFEPNRADVEIAWSEDTGVPAFYHCRITQADGHLAVSTPVWVG